MGYSPHIGVLDTKLGGHELQAGDVDGAATSTSAPSRGDHRGGMAMVARCTWIFWRTRGFKSGECEEDSRQEYGDRKMRERTEE